jgi:hypothetical protein
MTMPLLLLYNYFILLEILVVGVFIRGYRMGLIKRKIESDDSQYSDCIVIVIENIVSPKQMILPNVALQFYLR